ncbi:MAG TPA: hypothetical protein VHG29_07395 [Novosphingobium sp.]|nr:hypothetical protein [Novosphingobium sp.]
MRRFLASAAVLALVSVSAQADPGGGKGGGQGKGGGNSASDNADRGPGAARGNGNAKVDRRGAERSVGGPAMVDMRGEARGNSGKGNDRGNRGNDARGPNWDNGRAIRAINQTVDNRPRVETRWNRGPGLIGGCPPGLAKKNNGCLPPGLARNTNPYANSDWYRTRGLENGDYRYYDGYLLHMGAGGVLGYVPLLGGALAQGNRWPTGLNSVALPDYYRDYYGLGDPNGYRYYGDTIYRVDPQTSAISSIAALLTGDQFGVGQRLPSGYDVYNVPYDYRDRYVDGSDSMYRYSDGYVYQVDPTTKLVQAVIQLLT